ncbi:uncharacterized protein [Aegilops tauschii subsp. strangulata]|uniref:uncharacterized protein n=1 Tax=Aegilops tauschii subsp. strangulata TaxID=200361 RepID=UPI00098A6A73|nr:uncharacterized protein LOC109739534 [Aegilops tauschii subsp. strangulata]
MLQEKPVQYVSLGDDGPLVSPLPRSIFQVAASSHLPPPPPIPAATPLHIPAPAPAPDHVLCCLPSPPATCTETVQDRPVQFIKAWTGEKRRRRYLSPSSSDAPATAQQHQAPISNATDMEDTILVQEGSDEPTGPGVILSKEDQARYAKLLRPNIPPPIDPYSNVAWEDYDQVEERLARVRIACYKIVKPEAAHELKGPEEYTEDELRNESYFRHLEDDESFEWFFHRDDSQKPELNDYQRIVLRNFLPDSCERQYRYHNDYRSRYHTYEIDSVYVKYYGEISKKIKWIADICIWIAVPRRGETWIL